MVQRKTFRPLPKMPVRSLGQQNRRQRISLTWEPAGFDRYPAMQALAREMPVLGGVGEEYGGGNPDRYRTVGEQS